MTSLTPTGTPLQELASLGMSFPKWQDAVEAAIATDRLAVTGEVRGGQLIQYSDPSGAQLNILAVEPFATFVGFEGITKGFAHVQMVNDVIALLDIIDPFGNTLAPATANLAQGPLLSDEGQQQWQEISLAALALNVETYESPEAYENKKGEYPALFNSPGAEIVDAGTGSGVPDSSCTFAARVMEASIKTNELTGKKFIHAVMDGIFPFDLCLPESFGPVPSKDTIITGSALLTASVAAPSGGCGSGGGCGCGSGGCGSH